MDKILLILALLGLLLATYGQWRGDTRLVAAGWLGLALITFTLLT